MNKKSNMLFAIITILICAIGYSDARGPGDRKEEQKREINGGGKTGPKIEPNRAAPSPNRPSINRQAPSGQSFRPKQQETGRANPNFSGRNSGVQREMIQPRMNVKPPERREPAQNLQGRPGQSFRQTPAQLERVPGGGAFQPQRGQVLRKRPTQMERNPAGQAIHPDSGRAYRERPTQGQLQQFLNLPKNNAAGQRGPGLGKLGGAVLGGAAGAVALDHFLNKGNHPSEQTFVGHMPVRGDHANQRLNPQAAKQLRDTYSQRYHNMSNKGWWGQRPNLTNYYWHNHIWPHHPWNYWWRPATWVALSSWIVWNWGTPLYYDYGSNFYYDNGFVYLNDRRLCSSVEYYDQAVQIVSKANEVTDDADQWMPLGVFALTQDVAKTSDMVLQLAVNKDGDIQGTYYNTKDETAKPIKGLVEKQSQRAVWTFADDSNNTVIMETGIYNLTQDETEVLIHFGSKRTEEWVMVRLDQPPNQE